MYFYMDVSFVEKEASYFYNICVFSCLHSVESLRTTDVFPSNRFVTSCSVYVMLKKINHLKKRKKRKKKLDFGFTVREAPFCTIEAIGSHTVILLD